LKWLELRVPPPVVAVLAGVLMWLAARAFPALDIQVPARGTLAAAFGLIGLAIAVVAFLQFRRVGTTPNPRQPHESTTLVVAGMYRFSRNPMYLGDVLILAAWALWLANAAPFVFLPLFVAYINRYQIAPEERALESRYGCAYTEYRRAVRRWL
jgi:protein-S-isoprenylcysteine O-methyltransferase Ste14